MADEPHPIIRVLREDPRYKLEAYQFVRDALGFAQEVLGLGGKTGEESPEGERHLSGQELCDAIRRYAIDQYGLMARVVLASWGVTSTSDFGEIVYNLIRVGLMKKSPEDRREHFDNVYRFEDVFERRFQIEPPPEQIA